MPEADELKPHQNLRVSLVRCQRCFMLTAQCLCGEVSKITIKNKLSILMHASEERKSSNTARLIKLAIPETEITLFGKLGVSGELYIPADVTPLVLFPNPSAPLLDERFCERLTKPVMLIVPDGTWQQARKLIHRRENLFSVPRVRIARAERSRYRLRRNQIPDGLCTLEAVAEALAVLEGKVVKEQLLSLLDLMVSRVLINRHPSRSVLDSLAVGRSP